MTLRLRRSNIALERKGAAPALCRISPELSICWRLLLRMDAVGEGESIPLDNRKRGDWRGNCLELGLLAISPPNRTHYSTQRGHSTNKGQHGQAHYKEKTSPDIMEDYMIHNPPLPLVTVLLSTQPSARTNPGRRGIVLRQPASAAGAMPRPGLPLPATYESPARKFHAILAIA